MVDGALHKTYACHALLPQPLPASCKLDTHCAVQCTHACHMNIYGPYMVLMQGTSGSPGRFVSLTCSCPYDTCCCCYDTCSCQYDMPQWLLCLQKLRQDSTGTELRLDSQHTLKGMAFE